MKDCYCLKHTPSRIADITSMQIGRQPEYDKPIYAKARVAKLQYITSCNRPNETDTVKECKEKAEYLVTIMIEGV